MSKEAQGSKAAQCNDKENVSIAMAATKSAPRLHKAANIRGNLNGSNSKPTSNGSK